MGHLLKKSEKELEDFFIDNIHDLADHCKWGEIERIERQFVIPLKKGRIIADVMVWHKDGTGTCIEIKTGNNNRNDDLTAIGQLLFYGNIMEHSLGAMPRLILVSPSIKDESYTTVQRFNLPINFLGLTNDKCIYLSNVT
tara:strand:+ start:228 stop:647 length:420 start_codon:yes stop_codon:yes gene_type:complete